MGSDSANSSSDLDACIPASPAPKISATSGEASHPESSPWFRNASIVSALITGILGLIASLVGLIVSANGPAPVTVVVSPTSPGEDSQSTLSQETSSELPDRGIVSGTPPSNEPNFRLNFGEFQRKATDVSLENDQRTLLSARIQGRQVVWKGYVDEIARAESTDEGFVWTVALVESQEKLSQSMFKTPAVFRVGPSHAQAVEQLQVGDAVTMTGTVASHSLVATIIENGSVLR